jgi:hypothetical protein
MLLLSILWISPFSTTTLPTHYRLIRFFLSPERYEYEEPVEIPILIEGKGVFSIQWADGQMLLSSCHSEKEWLGGTSPNMTEAGVAPTDNFTSARAPHRSVQSSPIRHFGGEPHIDSVTFFIFSYITKYTESIRFHS